MKMRSKRQAPVLHIISFHVGVRSKETSIVRRVSAWTVEDSRPPPRIRSDQSASPEGGSDWARKLSSSMWRRGLGPFRSDGLRRSPQRPLRVETPPKARRKASADIPFEDGGPWIRACWGLEGLLLDGTVCGSGPFRTGGLVEGIAPSSTSLDVKSPFLIGRVRAGNVVFLRGWFCAIIARILLSCGAGPHLARRGNPGLSCFVGWGWTSSSGHPLSSSSPLLLPSPPFPDPSCSFEDPLSQSAPPRAICPGPSERSKQGEVQ